jgi:hypothetical protein
MRVRSWYTGFVACCSRRKAVFEDTEICGRLGTGSTHEKRSLGPS